MKNVLVTGGTGFIGRRLAEALRDRVGSGGHVFAIGAGDVDLTNREAVFAYFQGLAGSLRIDHVFHLAAVYKAGGWPVAHPATQYFSNLSINLNLLWAWANFLRDAKLTSALSYCMYPPHDEPHRESELWGTEPEPYLYSYAMTKKALLIGHKACLQEYGMTCTSVVLPTVYGPGGGFTPDSHVMGALIGKFVRAQRDSSTTVEVWGDGSQEREFMYVDDVVSGLLTAAERSDDLVYNLGSGQAYSVGEIAAKIARATGYVGEIVFKPTEFVGVRKRLLDGSAFRARYDWAARTEIDEGISRSVAWYRESLARENDGSI